MPGVLIRAFNAISIILYFVSACITGLTWVAIARMSYDVSAEEIDADVVLAIRLLLAETFACTLNTGLYSVDLGFSIRKSLRGV